MDATAPPPSLDVSRETPTDPPITRVFILPPEQIDRIREAGGPLAEAPDLSKFAQEAIVPVVEMDGKIVAYWPVWKAVHAEPLWVSTDHRRSTAIIRGILQGVETALAAFGEPVSFAIIGQDDLDTSGVYAKRLGFERVPGDLYYVMLGPAEEEK